MNTLENLIARLHPDQPSLYDAALAACRSLEDRRQALKLMVARLESNKDFPHLQRFGEAVNRAQGVSSAEKLGINGALQTFVSAFSHEVDITSIPAEERAEGLMRSMDQILSMTSIDPSSEVEEISAKIAASEREAQDVAARITALRSEALRVASEGLPQKESAPEKSLCELDNLEDAEPSDGIPLWKKILMRIRRFFGLDSDALIANTQATPQPLSKPVSQIDSGEEVAEGETPALSMQSEASQRISKKQEKGPDAPAAIADRLKAIEDEIRRLEERQAQLMSELAELRERFKVLNKIVLDNLQEQAALVGRMPEAEQAPVFPSAVTHVQDVKRAATFNEKVANARQVDLFESAKEASVDDNDPVMT